MKKGGSTEREKRRSQPAGRPERDPKMRKERKREGPIFVREKDDG